MGAKVTNDKINGYNDKAFEIYKIAVETRKLEIELFWRRGVYFTAFLSILFVAYHAYSDRYIFQMFVAAIGFIFSLIWLLQTWGSKYWHEAWEQKVERIEKKIMEINKLEEGTFDIFNPLNEEKRKSQKCCLMRSHRYSPSKLAIAVSLLFLFAWLVFWAIPLVKFFPECYRYISSYKYKAFIVTGVSLIIFIFSIWFLCRYAKSAST